MAFFDLPLDELRAYTPHVPEPADFDAFWAETLGEARAAGGPVHIVPIDPPFPHLRVWDMTFPGFGGQPIKAWFSRPASADHDLPILIQYQGYGGGRGLAIEHTFWPSAGYAHLMMDTRGQGSVWGGGGETPDPVGSASAVPGFMTRGILDHREYYYRRVFTDAVRAVDAARGLPGVNADATFIAGGSQGGGIALAVAGLVPELAGVMADVPFLCHFARGVTATDSDPFGEIRRYLATHRDHEEQVFTTLSYMDGVNFAKRATAPALFSVGLMDQVCPPSTVFAAFNAYGDGRKVRKDIEVYPYNGHENGGPHQTRRQWEFMRAIASP